MAKILGKPERVAYGPAEIEKVDIYKTKRPNAPTMIFLHGGAWRGGRSAQGAYHAEPFVNAGAHFINVEFNNVPETNGDLSRWSISAGARWRGSTRTPRASAAIPTRSISAGSRPAVISAAASSSPNGRSMGLPRNILKGALLGSGMYDLKPVRMSARSSYVKFTDEMEQALSAMRHLDKVHTPLVLTIGLLETPEFQRQSRDFAAALTKAGKPVKLIAAKGHNHFEMGESLSNPYGIMGRAALEMMKLNTRLEK